MSGEQLCLPTSCLGRREGTAIHLTPGSKGINNPPKYVLCCDGEGRVAKPNSVVLFSGRGQQRQWLHYHGKGSRAVQPIVSFEMRGSRYHGKGRAWAEQPVVLHLKG